MRKLLIRLLGSLALVGLLWVGGASGADTRIVRLDPRLQRLVPPKAVLEKVAEGFAWVEGPVWDGGRGHLLFSDIPNNAILAWTHGRGATVYLQPSGYSGAAPFAGREPGSNGLAFDAEGRLLIAEHGDRRISRLEKDGRRTTLADRFQGRRLNSPNDLAVKSNGDIYFTDPPFGLARTFADPARELDFCGVYRLSRSGELTLLTREIKAPNGIAFSPDEKILYVTDVDPARPAWLAYDVRADGTLGRGRVLVDAAAFTRTRDGGPDGLKVDRHGNLFAAGPGGVYVFAPDGAHLGTLETGVPTSNVAWGEDGSVLYVTASTSVYRIRLLTGAPGH